MKTTGKKNQRKLVREAVKAAQKQDVRYQSIDFRAIER